MLQDVQLLNLIGVAMLFFLGLYGMKHFKNTALQLLSFTISVLVAASVAGYLGLVESMLALFTVAGLLVVFLAVFVVYKLLRQIFASLASRRNADA